MDVVARRRRFRAVLLCGGALAVLLALTFGAWRLHDSRSVQLFGELVTSVATDDPVVALTFDDGPAVPHTDSILDLLRDEGVRATFSVTGEAVERRPALASRMLEEGHELGNHSYSHRPLVLVSPRTIRRKVERTDSLIRAAGADGPIHFRPPRQADGGRPGSVDGGTVDAALPRLVVLHLERQPGRHG